MALPSNRAEHIERIRRSLDSKAASPERGLFHEFVLAVARSVDLAALERESVADFIAAAEGTLEFVGRRTEGEIRVRVVHSGGTSARLESCMRDQPFLYDSLRMLFGELGVAVTGGFHAVVPVRRDEEGRIDAVGQKGMPVESMMRLQLEGVPSAADAVSVEAAVRHRLELVRGAVKDFSKMVVVVEGLMDRLQKASERRTGAEALAAAESRKLLGWLLDQNFIFMGAAYVAVDATDSVPSNLAEGLGTFRLEPLVADERLRARVAAKDGPLLQIHKTDALARIHRKGHLDQILVRVFDDAGAPRGLAVIEGVFAFRALAAPREAIPMVSAMGARLLEESGLPRDSYRARLLRYAFGALPVEFLLAARYEDVAAVLERVAGASDGGEARAALSPDGAGEAAWAFVALPKSDYDEELNERVAAILEARFGAPPSESGLSVAMQDTALLHYRVHGAAGRLEAAAGFGDEIQQLLLPWRERVRAALQKRFSEADADRLVGRYQDAFPEEYRRSTPAGRVVEDVVHLEELGAKPLSLDLFISEAGAEPTLRIYERDDLVLSDILPVLDHFGLRISSQYEHKLHLAGGKVHSMDSFLVTGVRGQPGFDVMTARDRLLPAIEAVFAKRFTDSPMNALLLRTSVSWRDVGILRSYLAYARQIGFRFPPGMVQDVLLAHAELARLLTHIFQVKFAPTAFASDAERAAALATAREEFLGRLSAVTDYAADSILRSLLNLIDATLRTNLYCRGETADNLALKFEVGKLELLKGVGNQPMFEIFVHHRAVHGVHLRGGKVARGGLRWSDRIDDYRTEVLGLQRTQSVKNAIIVPIGAKGGFVLQEPAESPRERRAQADACYKIFVSALLDVTDNIVDGRVVRPADVVAYDEDDPYLVVAADKGTAHLSDVANGLARERGFWLADAFASGGSNGYDHKATGITAKGAWVCARRHLRERGLDPDKDPITVVGIGDMSGDVFGNGLLCSRNFRLIGAFDHRHVFLDPNPQDPERSFEERKRLFELPGSSWEDYERALISPGGGVYPRGAKEIPLSPELRARLGLDATALSGEAMIRALLTLDVDLLWNGGIGTYVKASHEDHRDAGDRTNDNVRVDAKDVRAKVIAEGGNLGMTQAARVEFQALGGRCNTDAFDNSGGVDLSDHEVNLKILFAPIVKQGRLSTEARNLLLSEAEGEVVESVLGNNQSQSRLLSLDERRSRREPARFSRAVSFLARVSPFDPVALSLPDERTLRARAQKGEGMYRPELAMLSGWTKIYVVRELLAQAELDPRSPRLWPLLLGYFPRKIADAYRNDIAGHLLAREIGFTVLTNLLVGDAGVSFFPELEDWSGRSTSEVAAAYLSSAEAVGAWSVKAEVTALETGRSLADVVYPALLRIEDAVETGAAMLLSGLGGGTLETPAGARVLVEGLPANLPAAARVRHEAGVAELIGAGMPERTARAVIAFDYLVPALLAASVAERTGIAPELAFDALFAAGDATRLSELERRIATLPAEGRADAGALRTLRLRFLGQLGRAIADPERLAARGAAIGAEVARALREDLNLGALVTLEDRVQRLASQ